MIKEVVTRPTLTDVENPERLLDILKQLVDETNELVSISGRKQGGGENNKLDVNTRSHKAQTRDPGSGDDITQGYQVYSTWVNESTGSVFNCTSNAEGAAVWSSVDNTTSIGATSAANVGSGEGVFKDKSGNTLRFKSISAGSTRVGVSSTDDEVEVDVQESNLHHGGIGGLSDDDHEQYILTDGSRIVGFGTAGEFLVLDGDKRIVTQVINLSDIVETHKTPTSVNVVAGGAPVGTIAGAQTWNDGSVYQVPEVAGTPGFDIRFTLTGVTDFRRIVSNVFYAGSATHQVEWQIFNDNATTWETLTQVPDSMGYNYRYIDFPNDVSNYINGSDEVLIRLYHVSAGNAAHDVYVDYLALVS